MFVKENILKQFLVYEDEKLSCRTGQIGYALWVERLFMTLK